MVSLLLKQQALYNEAIQLADDGVYKAAVAAAKRLSHISEVEVRCPACRVAISKTTGISKSRALALHISVNPECMDYCRKIV